MSLSTVVQRRTKLNGNQFSTNQKKAAQHKAYTKKHLRLVGISNFTKNLHLHRFLRLRRAKLKALLRRLREQQSPPEAWRENSNDLSNFYYTGLKRDTINNCISYSFPFLSLINIHEQCCFTKKHQLTTLQQSKIHMLIITLSFE